MTKHEDPVRPILDRLQSVKQTGEGQYMARCPAHDDRHASLSIGRGDDGRALVHCHAGCGRADVLKSIGLSDSDLFPPDAAGKPAPRPRRPSAPGHGASNRIVTSYPYRNAAGDVLYEVVRYDPKGFRQRRPDGNGWTWKLGDVPRVLYRLPELLAADKGDWVFVVEGEKDADNLAALGLVATTNPGGAGKWGKLAYDSALRGRRVAIIPDKDCAGLAHAQDVAARLHGKAAVVKVIVLPDMPPQEDGRPRKDVSDWIEWLDGKTGEELAAALVSMAEAAPEWMPKADAKASAPTGGPVLVCMADVEPREVRWLWPGRVPLGRITLLVGRPGEGKSFLTTDMAARVTTGSPWPDGSECPAGSVILVSAEDDPNDTIRPRLDAHNADVRKVHLLSAVRRTDEEGQAFEVMFTLADVPALESALKSCPDCKLIVVDPIGSFLGGKTDAHRDNEVRGVLAPVARLAEKYGAAVVVVAHRRKSAGSIADDLALGSRAFTGIARAVWHLTRDSENKNRRLLLPGKNNLAPEGVGLAFSIVGTPGAVAWERDPVAMSADEALAVENGGKEDSEPGPEPKALNQATEWLAAELADEIGHPVKTLKDDANAAGLNWRTVQRASTELGVKVHRAGFGGGCVWRLPAPIRAKAVENGEPGTNGKNAELQGKTDDSARHECHTRQDDSLGTNGADDDGEGGQAVDRSRPDDPAGPPPQAETTREEDCGVPADAPATSPRPTADLDPDRPGPTDRLTAEQYKRYRAIYYSRPASMSPAEKHARAWRAALRGNDA
jgi:hypothetical protein